MNKILIDEVTVKMALEALEPRPGMPNPEYESLTQCAITALREALAEQPAQQEPVAWLDGPHLVMRSDWRDRANYKGPWVDLGRAIPDSYVPALYTTPQPARRKPLTDGEIMAIGKELGLKCRLGGNPNIDFDYARAIEAAHGIKENT